MPLIRRALVTGAFGYVSQHIARRLLGHGYTVRTLTNRSPPVGADWASSVEVIPYHFDQPWRLEADLAGVEVVFNTYWVRFSRGRTTHAGAVANTQNLIAAAQKAGVRRFVHVSITKPDPESPLSYFCGKAVMEQSLAQSGLSYAIVRPTVFFGGTDILINNIAWLLRHLPCFGIFGRGDYRLQPVHVADVADLAVELAEQETDTTIDAVGPETFTYAELVRLVRRAVGSRARLVHISPATAIWVSRMLRLLVGDVVITRDEIRGLMEERLVSEAPPTCPTRFSQWLEQNAPQLGKRYASELGRHFARSR